MTIRPSELSVQPHQNTLLDYDAGGNTSSWVFMKRKHNWSDCCEGFVGQTIRRRGAELVVTCISWILITTSWFNLSVSRMLSSPLSLYQSISVLFENPCHHAVGQEKQNQLVNFFLSFFLEKSGWQKSRCAVKLYSYLRFMVKVHFSGLAETQ